MLMCTDPFRELDRLSHQVVGPGTWSRPAAMPMDAAIELDVERNVLTVEAERRPDATGEHVEMKAAERPHGVYSRQLFLADTLDTDHVHASYEVGVLTLQIPLAEKAKPRRTLTGPAEQAGMRQAATPARAVT